MTVPETHKDILEKPGFAHVATIGPDGAPQSNPVWYEWDGSHLKFSQTTTRQKIRNIERTPRVAVSITDPDNPYRYIEIRGEVEVVEKDPEKAFIDKMAQKYLDKERYPWSSPEEERLVVKVRPDHVTTMG